MTNFTENEEVAHPDQSSGAPPASPPVAVVEVTTERESTTYRPVLDVVRFLAAIWVMLSHADAVKGGGIAVSVFFVLSGYLIGGLLLAEKRRTGRIDLSLFYFKRLLRIWIPYYIVLAFMVALFFARGQNDTAGFYERLYASLTYTYNLINDLRGEIQPVWVSFNQIWSLSIEEQFYLIAPLLICFLPPTAVIPICLLLMTVSLYASPLYAGLFMGMIMAATAGRIQTPPSKLPPGLIVVATIGFVAAATLLFISGQSGASQSSLQTYLLSCLVVLTAGFIPMPRWTHESLRTLGLMTYSYYLIHTIPPYFLSALYRRVMGGNPSHPVVMGIAYSLVALPISYAFVRWIELPTLRLRGRLQAQHSPLIPWAPFLAWGVSLLGFAGLLYAAWH